MPESTHPVPGGGSQAPEPAPTYFLDVIYPLAIALESGHRALELYGDVRGGDSSMEVAEAIGYIRHSVAQLCDSRRAEQLPVTAADTVARSVLEQYGDAHPGTSGSGLVAEALGALRAALLTLLAELPRGPEPSSAATA
ncbi:hypothetical protein [Streptomyces cylindrosporus]|uniref:Uncharacterized protein n=1 Tax=Streptomyces cylindrosporus TaxID=2927583 RepID=A0ABS9YK27_9ACTN|nr:hypothetical protein [Streptomyces cylindrosporus]MCI3277611.1 hypothetical protein [Streptomyces cylindrosporus]